MTQTRTEIPFATQFFSSLLGYVESFEEDGDLFIGIRFDDDTALTFTITPQTPTIANAELVKREHGESAVIKTYIKPK